MPEPKKSIDQIIEEAQAEGKFQDLEGKGKPLVLDLSPDAVIQNLLKEAGVKPDWIELEGQIDRTLAEAETLMERLAGEVASVRRRLAVSPSPSAEPAPEALARSAWHARLLRWLSFGPAPPTLAPADDLATYHRRRESCLERYAGLLHRANGMIRRFNLIVPLVQRQRSLINVGERLEEFVERFPYFERGPDGSAREVEGIVPAALLAPPPEEGTDPIARRDLHRAAAMHQVRHIGRRPPPIG
jgi:hypothetical protein